MSTTVIASAAGLSLYLAPWAAGKVDMVALNAVLLRHGLQPRGTEQPNLEFIAAEGLEPEPARMLAEDLRAIGMHVRVRKKLDLERSARVGQAIGMQFTALPVLMGVLLSVVSSGAMGIDWSLLAFVPPLLLIVANLVAIRVKGSNKLESASKPANTTGQVSQALLSVRDELPDGLFSRLLTQAQDLEAKVANNPDSQAAEELKELAASLRRDEEADVVDQVSELKKELDQARQAIREARKH
ncbi:MAG: hypothetical protein ACI9VR_001640 [Cognaticolwellia sp.]|jgi:hypothetical protein